MIVAKRMKWLENKSISLVTLALLLLLCRLTVQYVRILFFSGGSEHSKVVFLFLFLEFFKMCGE